MLRARWLGRVPYGEADQLQRALHERAADDYLLLLEHPHVYTLGTTADPAHVLVPPATVGAELVHADRGGDVTYHGPGPARRLPDRHAARMARRPARRRRLRAPARGRLIAALARLRDRRRTGSRGHRRVGRRREDRRHRGEGRRGRTRHGFALNVDPDLAMFDHIVPCGIRDRGVTSMAALLGDAPEMRAVVDVVVAQFSRASRRRRRAPGRLWREHPDDPRVHAPAMRWRRGDPPVRLARSPGRSRSARSTVRRAPPEWMRVKADPARTSARRSGSMQQLDLHTVCEEAGCPNIYECWADHTATFMILGDRCTRACGFCLVDTRKPLPVDPDEPGASPTRWRRWASSTP